jgi:flagellar biosynthesis/type III secretory pathway protein FliH
MLCVKTVLTSWDVSVNKTDKDVWGEGGRKEEREEGRKERKEEREEGKEEGGMEEEGKKKGRGEGRKGGRKGGRKRGRESMNSPESGYNTLFYKITLAINSNNTSINNTRRVIELEITIFLVTNVIAKTSNYHWWILKVVS